MTAQIISPRVTSNGGNNSVGSRFLAGNGAPSNTIGRDGDAYIDKQNPSFYGPKESGVWPSALPFGGTTLLSRMQSTPTITATQNGAQTVNLPVSNPGYIEVYVNGQLQPETFYEVNGSIVSLYASLGILTGDTYEVAYEYISSSGETISNTIIAVEEKPVGDTNGINKNFDLSYTPLVNTLNIYVNGLRIDQDEYILNDKSITLNLPPSSTSKVRTTYQR